MLTNSLDAEALEMPTSCRQIPSTWVTMSDAIGDLPTPGVVVRARFDLTDLQPCIGLGWVWEAHLGVSTQK